MHSFQYWTETKILVNKLFTNNYWPAKQSPSTILSLTIKDDGMGQSRTSVTYKKYSKESQIYSKIINLLD